MAIATRGEWLNPLNRLIWQQAFKAKKTQMTLRNGQVFNITYDMNDRVGKVWVQIAKGHAKPGFDSFTPCGWFDYDEVCDRTWITKDSSEVEKKEVEVANGSESTDETH
jgi:hypothetical protein